VTKPRNPPSQTEIQRAERLADMRAIVPQVHLSMDQVLDGRWAVSTACRDYPDLFHDPIAAKVAAAQAICARCPFNQPCRALRKVRGESGTWGGVHYLAPGNGVRAPRKKCAMQHCPKGVRGINPYCSFGCEHRAKAGTLPGYKLHIQTMAAAREAGEPIDPETTVCGPCRDAKTSVSRNRPPDRRESHGVRSQTHRSPAQR
jgi:hypothetical protein